MPVTFTRSGTESQFSYPYWMCGPPDSHVELFIHVVCLRRGECGNWTVVSSMAICIWVTIVACYVFGLYKHPGHSVMCSCILCWCVMCRRDFGTKLVGFTWCTSTLPHFLDFFSSCNQFILSFLCINPSLFPNNHQLIFSLCLDSLSFFNSIWSLIKKDIHVHVCTCTKKCCYMYMYM